MAGKRTYRSSQGKAVDLGALLLQNENTRAVGNMGVNARGDRIDNQGGVVDSKVRQTNRQYKKQIGPVDDLPVASRRVAADVTPTPVVQEESPVPVRAKTTEPTKRKTTAKKAAQSDTKKTTTAKKQTTPKKKAAPKIKEVSPTVLDIEIEEPVVEPVVEPVAEPAPVAPRGLADAIARARSIKQEQAKTPRQLAQEKAGVRKI